MRISGVADRLAGAVLGLGLGLLALGPGLRRGFLLSYDMVFVPREPLSAALPGLDPARAVPSDLVIAVASRIVPADVVQKSVLLAIFVLSCAGVAALLDREPLLARLAAGAFYAWNPYVGERLIIGQWALLLGYAGLPWVLRALTRGRDGSVTWKWAGWLALSLVPAVVGGFAAMAVTALVVVPAALLTRNAVKAAAALGLFGAGCLPWFVPSLLHPVYADPRGVAEFAARADTPFGTVGSLLMLGGQWNAQTVPEGYGGPWSAVWLALVVTALAAVVLLARSRWPGLRIGAVAGMLIACIGVTAAGRDALTSAVEEWPAIALVRDAQQFVAPLALAEALGFGLIVAWGMRGGAPGRNRVDAAGAVAGIAGLLAPVVLLPGLAWGASGRLRPVQYPESWLAAARAIDSSRERGAVLLLPWEAYRTPAWNHGETVLDPWPRLLSRTVIWNDGTQVGDVNLEPDDPLARRLNGVIQGTGPLTAVLRADGIRFVIDDADAPDAPVTGRLPGAAVLARGSGLTVYQLPG